jgi:hypothetical protein
MMNAQKKSRIFLRLWRRENLDAAFCGVVANFLALALPDQVGGRIVDFTFAAPTVV